MNTIKINESWKLKWDGMQYMLFKYNKGGKEVRNPKTGEAKLSEAKWVHTGNYFHNIESAVSFIIKQDVSSQAKDLKDFLVLLESKKKELEDLTSFSV